MATDQIEMELNPLLLDEVPEGFTQLPDGSVEVPSDELLVPEEDSDFTENLVLSLEKDFTRLLGSDLCELITKDKESRKKRDEQYEEGLRRTGLGNDAPGGADFDGASRVVHPVLVEACIDFSSRAIKELFPAAGPVKTQVIGEHDPKKTDRSTRKARFMNWQLTTQMTEYRSELEQLLTQLPMGGSQYQKFCYDDRLERPHSEFAPVDEILLPYAVADFYSAERATHRYMITRQEFKKRVDSKLYADVFVGLDATGGFPEQTLSSEANDKIEGREEDGYNEDGLRAILEVYAYLEVPEDKYSEGKYAPYIITVDEDSENVLAIYRNWAESDTLLRKLDWFVEWKFVPWRGAYGIGLPHIIGGLSAALTGALRALLDSAHINNAPSMLKLASRTPGQNKQPALTEVTEIDAPAGVDDIRKIAMPMPYNPPSPVLQQLMDVLYGMAKNVVATADDKMAQVGDRTPVGTTMALIEQGSAVYSAIHARLHASQKKALEILHRINSQYLNEERVIIELGEQLVTRDDFVGSLDVIPVSDPNIFSEAQRFAQTQAVVQMSQDQSVPWNKVNIYRRALRQMRVENIDELLPAVQEPITANFIIENLELSKGTPIRAALDQDHVTHIQGHLGWLADPLTQMNPFIPPQAHMAMLQHTAEHIRMFQEAAYAGLAADNEAMGLQQLVEIQPQVAQILQPYIQQIGQLHQQIQQKMPPPQMPPEVQASIQIAQMDTQRKAQYDQAMVQIKQQELSMQQQFKQAELQGKAQPLMLEAQKAQQQLQLQQQAAAATQELATAKLQAQQQSDMAKQQLEAAKFQLEQQRVTFEQQLKQASEAAKQSAVQDKLALEREIQMLRQQVELMKNEQDNAQKQETELQKNDDDNRTRLIIEEIRSANQSKKE